MADPGTRVSHANCDVIQLDTTFLGIGQTRISCVNFDTIVKDESEIARLSAVSADIIQQPDTTISVRLGQAAIDVVQQDRSVAGTTALPTAGPTRFSRHDFDIICLDTVFLGIGQTRISRVDFDTIVKDESRIARLSAVSADIVQQQSDTVVIRVSSLQADVIQRQAQQGQQPQKTTTCV